MPRTGGADGVGGSQGRRQDGAHEFAFYVGRALHGRGASSGEYLGAARSRLGSAHAARLCVTRCKATNLVVVPAICIAVTTSYLAFRACSLNIPPGYIIQQALEPPRHLLKKTDVFPKEK